MRKVIIILLLSFIPLLPSSGQAPVTDVAHTTATTLGHFKSFEEAVKSGVQLLNQLTVLKQTYEGMKAIKETFDKINQYIYNIQEIVDAAENLVNIIQRTSDIYRQAVRSNTFSLDELTFLMDCLTLAIEQGNRNVGKIKDYVTSGKWRFTDKERIDKIEDANSEMGKIEEYLENAAENLESISETRKKIEYMNENGMFTPMETYVTNITGRLTLGEELRLALSMMVKQNTTGATAQSAAKETTKLYDNLKNLFFALSAFIALLGAFRVYRKFNLEEDGLGKTIAIWFTSALTVFIFGSIVELFLF